MNTEIGGEYRNRLLDGPHGTVRHCVCDIVQSPALPSAVPRAALYARHHQRHRPVVATTRTRPRARCHPEPTHGAAGRRRAPLPGLLCSTALRPATGGKLKPRVPYRVLHGTSAQKPAGAAPRRATPPILPVPCEPSQRTRVVGIAEHHHHTERRRWRSARQCCSRLESTAGSRVPKTRGWSDPEGPYTVCLAPLIAMTLQHSGTGCDMNTTRISHPMLGRLYACGMPSNQHMVACDVAAAWSARKVAQGTCRLGTSNSSVCGAPEHLQTSLYRPTQRRSEFAASRCRRLMGRLSANMAGTRRIHGCSKSAGVDHVSAVRALAAQRFEPRPSGAA